MALEVAVGVVMQGILLVKTQVTICPLVRVLVVNVLEVPDCTCTPFTRKLYWGVLPPFTGDAVKVIEVPDDTLLALATIETEGTRVEMGLTVILKVLEGPVQVMPLLVETGVTVMVAIIGLVPVLAGVKDGMLPVPFAANPMEGWLLVQWNTVPGTGPLNPIMGVLTP